MNRFFGSDVKGILLIPAEGDPDGLLEEGPCGARPPMAYWYKRGWAACAAKAAHSHDKRRALVLAWDGAPVFQGYPLAADDFDLALDLDAVLRGLLPSMSIARQGSTLVFGDADGRELHSDPAKLMSDEEVVCRGERCQEVVAAKRAVKDAFGYLKRKAPVRLIPLLEKIEELEDEWVKLVENNQ